MCHEVLSDSRLWPFLLQIDTDLAGEARQKGCPSCGSPLHRADYPRKPRGAEALPAGYESRFSFSCSADGCRRRLTPPSVRFLGPKVYLKILVLLITAMRQGPSRRSLRQLERFFGASRRTIARWQSWWREIFTRSLFWKEARSRFAPPLREAEIPRSLLDAFASRGGALEKLLRVLRFLSPITTRLGLALQPS